MKTNSKSFFRAKRANLLARSNQIIPRALTQGTVWRRFLLNQLNFQLSQVNLPKFYNGLDFSDFTTF